MKQKIIDSKKYSKFCMNCFFGRSPKDDEVILCEKNGIVDPNGKCRHYQYDPIKRRPERISIDNNYDENDFKL